MNAKKFSDAMNELDAKYIEETLQYKKKSGRPVWVRWGALAACLCLIAVGGIMSAQNSRGIIPSPESVQTPNPIITAASAEEMERYLDFHVPVLDKEVESYSVFIEDSYPTMGQVNYTDGSEFRIKYGNGDISGIYGGTLERDEEIEGVQVEYYEYEDISYAIWEEKGFTFSYVYTDDGSAEVALIIRQFG